MSVMTSKASNEWYTPPHIVERARAFFGGKIDLDPASCAKANEIVNAHTWFTFTPSPEALAIEDAKGRKLAIDRESLAQLQAQAFWTGNVWCNPPYSHTSAWLQKGITSCKHGANVLMLTNSAPGYVWFESAWRRFPVCMLEERLRFIEGATMLPGASKSPKAQCIWCLAHPRLWEAFSHHFSDLGRVLLPDTR